MHFGRAAARLFLAQQALSREIARLERDLGVRLLDRSTRRVALTPEGERLLPRARELLALADRTVEEVRGIDRPLVVDVVRGESTAARVLTRARTLVDERQLEGRFHGGFAAALAALLAHRVDVAFGRTAERRRPLPDQLARRLIRWEPLGLLVTEDHEFARERALPVSMIKGLTVDTSAGNVAAPEWVELATELVEHFGGTPSPEHHPGMDAVAAAGADETAHHLRSTGWPIVSMLDVPPVPGARLVPFTDPVPLYPWTMVHRSELQHPGLAALVEAADAVAETERWLEVPADAWVADDDRGLIDGNGHPGTS